MGEAGSSQLDRQEDSDVQELRMQYSSLNTYSDTSVMAGNVPAASVTQAGEMVIHEDHIAQNAHIFY